MSGYPWCWDNKIVAAVEGNSIILTHLSASYNCCPDDIEVTLSHEGNYLSLQEREIVPAPCDCLCCYNITTEIGGLVPGEYTIEYCWLDYETSGELSEITVAVLLVASIGFRTWLWKTRSNSPCFLLNTWFFHRTFISSLLANTKRMREGFS